MPSLEAADALHKQIKALYPPTGFPGHCLQICVPASALNRFVYPCVFYGKPITLHAKHEAYVAYDRFPPVADPPPPARFEEVLLSPSGKNMQARIIAHPNLFLRHGAVVNVLDGDYRFDPDAFRSALRALVRPYLPDLGLADFAKYV
jgi:hypothetical protein